MIKLTFVGDVSQLLKGITAFSAMFDFQVSPDGIQVVVEKHSEDTLLINKSGSKYIIKYKERIHFFRALGLLLEELQGSGNVESAQPDGIVIRESIQFTMNGAMFDVSQGNAVINTDNVKKLLARMAVMGLNMLMLYTEDSYEIKDEPYFGYMRSKYTCQELKDLDDYADMFGIEMIPCIQTLAHLIDALKWSPYRYMKEDDDTLLVGCEEAYVFIEKMIAAASEPFRSKRIHIGMDEAWKLGQGEYLKKNGYRSKFDIMTEHLSKVLSITEKYGLTPMIWSDMFFRAASRTGDYYDKSSAIPKEVIDKTPQGVQLVYWDYYHADEEFYIDWINRHRAFGSDPIFAGGLWSWTGFTLNYGITFAHTNPALTACKNAGVKEVFTTIWGDDSTECNIFANLLGLQLYAEHGYSRDLDTEKLRKRFKFCTGADYDAFMDISYIDEIPGTKPGNINNKNASKYLMWQDILSGLFDKNIKGLALSEHYKNLEQKLEQHSQNNGEFSFVFEYLKNVSSVLSIKAEIGLKLYDAYKTDNKAALKEMLDLELPELAKKVTALKNLHRDLWMQINKPLGWEIFDLRYGCLLARIDTAAARLKDYLSGKICCIEELEQERLHFQNVKDLLQCNVYNRIPSASRISITTGYGF